MKLKKATIHKYKCIESEQSFDVNEEITVLVGMNESGKTSVLEALAKSNYFQKDEKFKYNTTHDYPRREKKALDKSGEDAKVLTCIYSVSDELHQKIAKDLGEGVFTETEVTTTNKFSNGRTWSGIKSDKAGFLENKTKKLGIWSKALTDKLSVVKNGVGLDSLIGE